MDNLIKKNTQAVHTTKAFIKWIFISILCGAIVGVIGASFGHAIHEAGIINQKYPMLIFGLPLGGVVIAFLYKKFGTKSIKGTNLVIEAVYKDGDVNFATAPLIYISTFITHIFGGSAGKEGAALQIGSSITAYIGKLLKLDDKDQRVMVMVGMSAGFAAVFGTPITATIFAMEVVSVGVMYYSAFVPCLIAALTGNYIANLLGIGNTFFNIVHLTEYSARYMLATVVIAITCAMMSFIFCKLLHFSHHQFDKIKNAYLKPFIGAILVIITTFILGTRMYNGASFALLNQCFDGNVPTLSFLFKMILTAITLGCGFKGGEIVPTFIIGATIGNILGPILGINASFGAAIGLLAMFCGVTNAPLSTVILSIELFGGQSITYFALAVAISYMLSGYDGLYSAQKILYSKTKALFTYNSRN